LSLVSDVRSAPEQYWQSPPKKEKKHHLDSPKVTIDENLGIVTVVWCADDLTSIPVLHRVIFVVLLRGHLSALAGFNPIAELWRLRFLREGAAHFTEVIHYLKLDLDYG